MTHEEQYKEVEGMFKRLSDQMCHVVQAFYLWRVLVFSRSIPEVGKEQAEKNVEIIRSYQNFFAQTENSHLETFIIGITKFYDRDLRSLTLDAIINKMCEYQNDITAETLINIYPDRFDKDELRADYRPFDEADLVDIGNLRQENKQVLENLIVIRNKQAAHTNIEIINVTFIPTEVEKFIEDTQKIFNKLQERFSRASTVWDHMKEGVERDTRLLYENLHRGEVQRKEEIRQKWGVKLP